jgi:hypothetical protein
MKKGMKRAEGIIRSSARFWPYLLGFIFLVAGVLKLLSGTQTLAAGFPAAWPPALVAIGGALWPWLEIGLALWLLSGWRLKNALAAATGCVVFFIALNVWGLLSGSGSDCHCLGQAISLTHTQSLIADLIMLAMAVISRRFAGVLPGRFFRLAGRLPMAALAALAILAVVLSTALVPAGLLAEKTDFPLHPLMQPNGAELARWEADYQRAPLFSAPDQGTALKAIPPVFSLLDYIDYVPAERDQGYVGNCWVWAGTGLMEVALNTATGTRDRLSIQYVDSNYFHDGQKAGCGGELADFANFYNGNPAYNQAAANHIAVPWSNSGGRYYDYFYSGCNDFSGTVVSTTPNYPVLNTITALTIPTTGLTRERAISNIKSALLNKQAVFLGFYMPYSGAHSTWYNFFNFWNTGDQNSTVWNPDLVSGLWPDVAGHGVVCVGYDDTNNSWILLNSWGTTPGRPNGTFRMTQNLNYDCTYSCDEDTDVTVIQWQTLSPIFSSSIPSVTTHEASVLSLSQAALFGNLMALGGTPQVSVSFEYGPTQNYGQTTPSHSLTAPGRFSTTLSGLSPDITYHFRAKAVGDQTVYGPDMTFKTSPPPVPALSNLTMALTVLGLGGLMVLFLRLKFRAKIR